MSDDGDRVGSLRERGSVVVMNSDFGSIGLSFKPRRLAALCPLARHFIPVAQYSQLREV